MSTDRLSLSHAPQCEPGYGAENATGSAVPQPVPGASRRRTPSGSGLRRAVRAGCAGGVEVVESDAQRFAEQSVRLLLEVVDRRRQVDQLRAVTEPRVLESVRTMLVQDLAPGRGLGTATVKHVRLTACEAAGAELFASYQRGARTFALAGRIESARERWRLVALRMY
ncbi:Rv3235 family protein [Nocardia asteroides]|uniref:Rv3235 family protein n=1 Tax=Nocardia asteroides TaxID=1824 RepID=UPI001E321B08|nr:Rv3235 family protein [Nocardia asteroides]UGT53869.1 Rv3235 family protein [Nocardia asteroides]